MLFTPFLPPFLPPLLTPLLATLLATPHSDSAFASDLEALLGASRVGRRVSLGAYTTFRVGGPADWFVEPRTRDELVRTLGCVRPDADGGLIQTVWRKEMISWLTTMG